MEKIREFKVSIGEEEFSFTAEEIAAANLVATGPGTYHIIKNHRSVNVKMIAADLQSRTFAVEVEGTVFPVRVKSEMDAVLEKMGFGKNATKQISEVKAPMPGLVLEINVTEGQVLKKGDKILILVAMKMENSIMIHADASIKRIAVKAGEAVEKGQLLVELDS
ncbi:MAG: biotin/lipoyl-binding protein [Terrimonas sp.]|nr:biotin/lipoyl-binding protein [Terrimonas sp.]